MTASDVIRDMEFPLDEWRQYLNSDVLDLIECDDFERVLKLLDARNELANVVDLLERVAENEGYVSFGEMRQAVAHLNRALT